jgi:hypothetical protein
MNYKKTTNNTFNGGKLLLFYTIEYELVKYLYKSQAHNAGNLRILLDCILFNLFFQILWYNLLF